MENELGRLFPAIETRESGRPMGAFSGVMTITKTKPREATNFDRSAYRFADYKKKRFRFAVQFLVRARKAE
ncbi:MAG: hypothetical protein ACREC0_00535 [Methylocella sp.]